MRMVMRIGVLAGFLSVMALAQGTSGGLSFELKGLTKENAPRVEMALAKLDRTGFQCPACEYFAKEAGNCPGCGTALVAEKAGMLLKDVKIDPAKNIVTFGVAGAHGIRLSEISGAVTPLGVHVNESAIQIVPFTRLMLTGVKSDEEGKAIEKAILDAKLYDAAKIVVNTKHEMAIVIVGTAKAAPTYEQLRTTIEKAGAFKVAEVSWIGACPKCAEKGLKHAGCMACWEKKT